MNKLKDALIKSVKSLWQTLPMLIGMILLISLANVLIPKTFYLTVFRDNIFLDPFVGSFIGSILAGSPVTSYIIGGELLKQGISLVAVTAFLVAWVTVGMVQMPAESIMLGKKFAIVRNITAFLFSIIVAIITIIIVGAL
jgi:uncharacterized membrane protein YraQ (UPF0718 family)